MKPFGFTDNPPSGSFDLLRVLIHKADSFVVMQASTIRQGVPAMVYSATMVDRIVLLKTR